MKKQNIIAAILFVMVGFMLGCIIPSATESGSAIAADETDAVDAVIDEFQEAYSSKKMTDVQNLFHYRAVIGIDFDNHTKQDIMSLAEWVKETKEMFKEEIFISDKLTNRKIEIHRSSMATVVCDYDYRDSTNHQTGVDIFSLMKIRGKWKIISLIFSGDSVGD
ncbi:nuclear transport factor 2 family protein [bacterium]|nr:nuclear transport factor 2 family protein [bacterium]